MLKDYLCETAIGEGDFAPETWMTPSALYCLCAGDPSQLGKRIRSSLDRGTGPGRRARL